MASPSPVIPSASVIGQAFVEQYYHILHQSPELVHKFYHEPSTLSRQSSSDDMTTVTTLKAIDECILSLTGSDNKYKIDSVDSQNSHNDGVTVLVTGSLTRKDNLTKSFCQNFFLAPQDKGGYFVLNDVLRFLKEGYLVEINSGTANGVVETASTVIGIVLTACETPDAEPAHIPVQVVEESVSLPEEHARDTVVEVCDPSPKMVEKVVSVVEQAPEPVVTTSKNQAIQITKLASSVPQEDGAKKSYAFIVKQENKSSTKVNAPAKLTKASPLQKIEQPIEIVASAAKSNPAVPNSNGTPENANNNEEVEGHSIYIRGMPMNISVQRVEDFFKTFGTIKPMGVQVRSNRANGICFGFVEFDSLSSMQSAVKASPVTIDDRKIYVEEKKTTSRGGGNSRGPFVPGNRGGGLVHNGSFRERGNERGNLNGPRSYPRNDFGNRGSEFSGRGRSQTWRNGGEGHQRFNQNGNGRVIPHENGVKQTAVSA